VATVWLGKDDNTTTAEYGASAALPIWMTFMGEALKGQPPAMPEPPAELVTAQIDPDTGRRLSRGGISEIFHPDHLPGTQPRRVEREVEQRSGSQGTGTYEAIF